MDTLKKTEQLLQKYGIYAKKSYGQNFLVDDVVLEKIIKAGNLNKSDIVIEIGPGLGNLTERLLHNVNEVIAFEIDTDMVNILQDRFADSQNFTLVAKDIMEIDLKEYINNKKVKVIANLPYYITSPILFRLLEYVDNISDIVIMVQKEVADRILAVPCGKEYGVLTVNTRYICDAIRVVDVPNTSFVPAPNVTSTVVKLTINLEKSQKLVDEVTFKKLVKVAFSQRRKKVINSIINSNVFDISKEQLTKYILELGHNENARAEEISYEEYIELSNKLYERKYYG